MLAPPVGGVEGVTPRKGCAGRLSASPCVGVMDSPLPPQAGAAEVQRRHGGFPRLGGQAP